MKARKFLDSGIVVASDSQDWTWQGGGLLAGFLVAFIEETIETGIPQDNQRIRLCEVMGGCVLDDVVKMSVRVRREIEQLSTFPCFR